MLIPRGKYDFDFYQKFLKIHGKTHDYKIKYSQFNRAFVLPKPDSIHMYYVIALNSPVRIGQALHSYLVLSFKKEREVEIDIDQGALEGISKDELQESLNGTLFDVLSRLLKSVVGIQIIVPDGFKSHKDTHAVKCSNKA